MEVERILALSKSISPRAGTNVEPGGVIGVSLGGNAQFWSFGCADLDRGIINTPDTIFNFGSVAKSLTAYLLLRSLKQFNLTTQMQIGLFMPNLPKPLANATIADLLHHTSGLPDYQQVQALRGDRQADFFDMADALRLVSNLPLQHEPGECFSYSNAGYVLLAALVTRLHRRPFSQIAVETVFDPLELHSARIRDRPTSRAVGEAPAYRQIQCQWEPEANNHVTCGDTNLLMSAKDALKWARFWSASEASSLDLGLEARSCDGTPLGYAGGLFVNGGHIDEPVLWHGGAFAGFRTFLLSLPQRGAQVVVAANWQCEEVENIGLALASDLSRGVIQLTRPESPRPRRRELLAGFVGVANGTVWKLDRVDGVVALSSEAAECEIPDFQLGRWSLADRNPIEVKLSQDSRQIALRINGVDVDVDLLSREEHPSFALGRYGSDELQIAVELLHDGSDFWLQRKHDRLRLQWLGGGCFQAERMWITVLAHEGKRRMRMDAPRARGILLTA